MAALKVNRLRFLLKQSLGARECSASSRKRVFIYGMERLLDLLESFCLSGCAYEWVYGSAVRRAL